MGPEANWATGANCTVRVPIPALWWEPTIQRDTGHVSGRAGTQCGGTESLIGRWGTDRITAMIGSRSHAARHGKLANTTFTVNVS